MTNVACFCGCLYYFDGSEGPCPKCGAVAVVNTTAIRPASHDRERSQPDAAAAGAGLACADATPERPVNPQRHPRGGFPTDWFTRHPVASTSRS